MAGFIPLKPIPIKDRNSMIFVGMGRIDVRDGAFVVIDEAQNCTAEQLKMFLTRLGFDSRAVITGDITQTDLPGGKPIGLIDAVKILKNIKFFLIPKKIKILTFYKIFLIPQKNDQKNSTKNLGNFCEK